MWSSSYNPNLSNSKAREWRHDSDKQIAMVDHFVDFFKGKSRCS